ncbi:MAG: nitroreductase [Erysipelotrichaceae bacterium]|jgi:hypothetical protein|nr:nitroreductase [Erysipelotrichaceae bacterium]
MNKDLYPAIFKRKSFHSFKLAKEARITLEELKDIEAAFLTFEPLYKDIKVGMQIVPAQGPGLKRDAEYCILLYSEKKDNSLVNLGYLGEQLDLYLVNKNIATLWFGFGNTKLKTYQDLEFVTMIAIAKTDGPEAFRKDISEFKRFPVEDIWKGETLGVAEVARLAPSACNFQPWFVENHDGLLKIYRHKNKNNFFKMPTFIAFRFNRIDVGIFLCFLELALQEKGYSFKRTLFVDPADKKVEFTKVAEYMLVK